MFDAHMGESLVPYATLEPRKVVLPLKEGDRELSIHASSPGGIRVGGMERRMRVRWRTISQLWEENKTSDNNMKLFQQLDYYGKLSSQLEWQRASSDRPVRLVYNQSGAPTAALIRNDEAIVDYTLYWIGCKSIEEAHYLLAIINSDALADAVNRYTIPNWAGKTRHLQKHLWKLPIAEYDAGNATHKRHIKRRKAYCTGRSTLSRKTARRAPVQW